MRQTYIRLIGWVLLAAAVAVALFAIPVRSCGTATEASKCITKPLIGSTDRFTQIVGNVVGWDYQWPLRIGIIVAGVVVLLVAYAIASPSERRSS
jgi:hypothetical protein